MPGSFANGRYHVLETLRDDALEVVLRCRDTLAGREVLIEAPGPALRAVAAEEDLSRAVREARALGRIAHPGVQRLLDVIEGDGFALLVLEPVSGELLSERLERVGKLSCDEASALARDLTEVLAAVHEAGIVHRALAPENVVLLPDGGVSLRGFRFAKGSAGLAGRTSLPYEKASQLEQSIRAILPRYSAPEQIGGEPAGPRTDLFGLGCLLYYAATGEEAYDDLLADGAPRPPRSFSRVLPGAPDELAKAVDACLAWSPLDRPRSAAEIRDQLRGSRGKSRAASRRPRAALVGVGVLALIGFAFWDRSAGEPPPAIDRGVTFAKAAVSSGSGPGVYTQGWSRSYAFLIGIGEYQGSSFAALPNAEGDVRAVAARLEELPAEWTIWGDAPLLGRPATGEAIVDGLDELLEVLEPEDRVFIYFAGHGERRADGETGWMVPADAEEGRASSYVLFDHLDNFLRDARAKHVLVALDCCYAGRLVEAPTMRSGSASPFEVRYLTREARVVLCSGRDEPVSDGERGARSPFARAFLEALVPDGRAGVTSSQIFAQVQERFDVDGLLDQSPMLARPAGRSGGEFVFLFE